MNRFLRTTVLALSMFSCAGKDKIVNLKPAEPTAAEKERIAACRKTRENVKRIMQDPERPWTHDLSHLADELLVNCSMLESEVIDALRALLARKAKSSADVARSDPSPSPLPVREIIREVIVQREPEPEPEPTSPDAASAQPKPVQPVQEILCEKRLANVEKICGVPALSEVARYCGKQKPLDKSYSGETLERSTLNTIIHPDITQDEWFEIYCSLSHSNPPHSFLLISRLRRFSADNHERVERWHVSNMFPDEPNYPVHEYDYLFVPTECRRVPKEEKLPRCSKKQIRKLMEGLCPPL